MSDDSDDDDDDDDADDDDDDDDATHSWLYPKQQGISGQNRSGKVTRRICGAVRLYCKQQRHLWSAQTPAVHLNPRASISPTQCGFKRTGALKSALGSSFRHDVSVRESERERDRPTFQEHPADCRDFKVRLSPQPAAADELGARQQQQRAPAWSSGPLSQTTTSGATRTLSSDSHDGKSPVGPRSNRQLVVWAPNIQYLLKRQ
ncbi:unnamed protein product [Pleuronectes platessa]|uniref:Uncharacterized protein n=1 Tax=Pleuronectes platessa TaxID=8262 RepID=A0A9N7UEN2_PLEPL|nr:unnamed protein product [Pleuronectes platessa]